MGEDSHDSRETDWRLKRKHCLVRREDSDAGRTDRHRTVSLHIILREGVDADRPSNCHNFCNAMISGEKDFT